MRKLLLALPLFAGASWAGTTLYSGAQTEPAYNRLLAQMNASELFIVESKEYESGFTSSTAITEIRSKPGDDAEFQIFLKHKISHSPVSMVPETARFGAASIVTTLMVDDSYSEKTKQFLTAFESGEPFVATTKVAMDGATNSEIKVNAIDLTEDGKTIRSSGTLINLATTINGSISGDAMTKDMFVSESADQKGELSDLSMQFNLAKIETDAKASELFYDLNLETKFGEIKITEAGSDVALIKGASYIIDQKLTSDNPHMKFSMGVESLVVEEIPLQSFNLEGSLTGFSVKESIANEDVYAGLKSSDDPMSIIFSPKGLELLRASFRPDTKLNINAKAMSVDGGGDANINLWFTGNGSNDGYTGMATIGDLAKSFAGNAVVDLDRAPLMQTPLAQMLEHPMAQVYLTITDDKVMLNADLDKMILKVNEQMIPLELMAGEMLDMPLEMLLQM